ncbi:MAG: hypothetical protein NTW80_14145 [Deltaproteobacteria bacterium]|nr:hypothetical protein [Deltaproteobacteria bacterium]
MVVHLWHSLIVALMALSLIMGCASSPYVGTGAAVGGGLGAITGALIGSRNPWAGALIGGAVGTGLGAAGGYALQQRQASQPPPQGYYNQQPAPGYGYNAPAPPGYAAPPPPAYGNRAPAPGGQSYGGASGGYNTPNPVTPAPQYSEAPAATQYGQNQAQPQPSSVHTPIAPAPYKTYE